MTTKYPYPDDIDLPLRLWGFTPKDITKTAITAGAGYMVGGPIGAVAGAGIGVGLSKIRPQGESIESHLANLATLKIKGRKYPEIEETRDTGVLLTNGDAVGFIEVNSCDLGMLSEQEKNALARSYWQLFKVLDYPIEIHSKQQEIDISEYPTPRENGLKTHHIVTVKVGERTDQFRTLEKRCREVRNELNKGDLSSTHLTGRKLKDYFPKSRSKQDPSHGITAYDTGRGNLQKHYPIYIEGISGDANLGWISELLNTRHPVDVVQVVEPVDVKTPKKIDRIIDRLSAEIPATPTAGRRRKLQNARQTAEWLLKEQADGEQLVRYGVYIYPKASTSEGLQDAKQSVRKVLYKHSVQFRNAIFRTHKAAKTWSSFTHDELDKSQIVPATAAAMGIPFATQDRLENGVCYGIDTRNGMPVTLNRFSWNAGHTIIAGVTGSGKSYESKLVLLREIPRHDDIEVKIVDPKKEYVRVGKHLQNKGVDVEICYPTDSSEDVDEELADAVREVYGNARSTDGKTIIVIDEARRLLRTKKGSSALSDLVSEGRDRQVSVTLITQTIADFYKQPQGRDILANVPCRILFSHEKVDTVAADSFKLSPEESAELKNLARGDDDGSDYSEAILEVSGRIKTKLRILSTAEEHKIITGEEHPHKTSYGERGSSKGKERNKDNGRGGGDLSAPRSSRSWSPSISVPSISFNIGVKSSSLRLLSRNASFTDSITRRSWSLLNSVAVLLSKSFWNMVKKIVSGISRSLENLGPPEPEELEFDGFRDPPFNVGGYRVNQSLRSLPINRYSWPVTEKDPQTAVQDPDVDYALQIGQHTIGLGYDWGRLEKEDTPDRAAVMFLAGFCGVSRPYVRKYTWVNKSNPRGIGT